MGLCSVLVLLIRITRAPRAQVNIIFLQMLVMSFFFFFFFFDSYTFNILVITEIIHSINYTNKKVTEKSLPLHAGPQNP